MVRGRQESEIGRLHLQLAMMGCSGGGGGAAEPYDPSVLEAIQKSGMVR